MRVWLGDRAQNAVVSGRRLFQTGSPGMDYFGPQLFNIFINDLADDLCPLLG